MHKRLQFLLQLHLTSSLNEAEFLELQELLQSSDQESQINVFSDSIASYKSNLPTDPQILNRIIESVLNSGIQEKLPVSKLSFFQKHWIKAAAAVLLLSAGIAYFQLNKTSSTADQAQVVIPTAPDTNIPPGSNKAMLTLADGSTILLDSASNGTLAIEGTTNIIKHGKTILYKPGATKGNDKYALNTMTTPRGGQYTLTLPDGSRVWLNAASSITYPIAFGTGPRRVAVTGEVYLDIRKDAARPFYVGVNATDIQVLGTSFNINAYPNEAEQLTTLIEGSVKIISSSDSTILRPGQQGIVNRSGALRRKTEVNTEEVVAWKNGFFNFDRADIRSVMRDMERWYDIDVEYQGNPPAKLIQGKMERRLSLAQVLGILEKMDIHTQLNGRKLKIIQ